MKKEVPREDNYAAVQNRVVSVTAMAILLREPRKTAIFCRFIAHLHKN